MTAETIVAIHALVFLNHKKGCVSSEKLAENICTNPARVRKVLAKLKKAELVVSRPSTAGGYAFEKDPAQVTLCDVYDAMGEQVVGVAWRSGDDCAACPISRGMKPVMNRVFDQLEEACRTRLAQTTIAEIDAEIFSTGK